MYNKQIDNFLAILRTAVGNGQYPLHDPDWNVLISWARTQFLTALFYKGAQQYPEFKTYETEQQRKLQLETIAIVGIQSQRTQRFFDIYQALTDAGLKPIVMKGVICRNLYGSLADYRPSSDEDLYVPPEQIRFCCDILEHEGFSLISNKESVEFSEQQQEITFRDMTGTLQLEIHPTLFGGDLPEEKRAAGWFTNINERKILVELYGKPFYTFSYTDHYIYLFLHLVKHFCNAGVGIRQIMDLAKFHTVYQQEIDWNQVQKAVQSLSSPRFYADILSIGYRLGFPLISNGVTSHADDLLTDILCGGIYGNNRPGNIVGERINLALRYPKLFQRVQRLLFPSVQQLATWHPDLIRRPWLLPIVWIGRFQKLAKQGFGEDTRVSLREARKRRHLFLSYGLTSNHKH